MTAESTNATTSLLAHDRSILRGGKSLRNKQILQEFAELYYLFTCKLFIDMGRDSVVGIATGYGLDDRRLGF
jgi:hypothetical protein